MKPKLKPCPFCGAKPRYQQCEEAQSGCFIECPKCLCSSRLIVPEKTDPYPLLADSWNQRVLPANVRSALITAFAALTSLKQTTDDKEWRDSWKPMHGAFNALSKILTDARPPAGKQ